VAARAIASTRSKLVLPDHWPILILATIQVACQLYILSFSVEAITSSITIDDTYYYLQTAWNVKELGFPTFDGIHRTNGFQFAWFVVVMVLAYVAPTKATLLYTTLAVCFLLNTLAYIPIWRIGIAMKRQSLAIFMGTLWLFVTLGSGVYMIGMENSLHAFVFWLSIWQIMLCLVRLKNKDSVSFTGLVAVLTLNAWTRVEAGLFSAFFFLLVVVASHRELDSPSDKAAWYRQVTGSVAVSFSGLFLMLAFFKLTGGTFLPISALVKQEWASWNYFFAGRIGFPGLLLLLLLAPIGWAINQLYLPANRQVRSLMKVWFVLLAGVIIHLMLTERTRAYSHYSWYLSPAIIFLIVTGGITLDWTGNVLTRRFQLSTGRHYQMITSLFLIGATIMLFYTHTRLVNPLYQTRYQVASWMHDNLPDEFVCASWNAGQFGYYSGHTIVNLDGLINGLDYYKRVITGPLDWSEFIEEKGVHCIVDYGDRIQGRTGFTLMEEFPIVGLPDRKFYIWHVDH
jgi:hypothetical protein